MTVDDGFSVLEAGRAEMGTKHSSKAIEVVRVPLAKVIPNPYQPRKTFDEDGLQDLAASIAQYGVLQPLLVAPMEDGSGNYLLIAGERRLRASKMAALSEIPVIISDYTQQQIAEIALIENPSSTVINLTSTIYSRGCLSGKPALRGYALGVVFILAIFTIARPSFNPGSFTASALTRRPPKICSALSAAAISS